MVLKLLENICTVRESELKSLFNRDLRVMVW